MSKETAGFDAENATLAMSNDLKDEALRLAQETGGDPVPALIGAAMKVIKETMGDQHVAPLMQRMMTTVVSSEGEPSSYN